MENLLLRKYSKCYSATRVNDSAASENILLLDILLLVYYILLLK